jgi:EAL domain-containing protein (putative c-di-GMP-specific phosphodiesterase class I)
MAEGLGMEVVCEGVETEEQIIILKKIGCRLVQGYYYSKPIPLEEFMDKYLSSKNING